MPRMTKKQITPSYSEVKPERFYVYLHRREDNGEPFYVGKGRSNRGFSKIGRNKYWKAAFSLFGCVVEIVKDNMDEVEALLLEKECIDKLRADGFVLCNICRGGGASSGRVVSEGEREKLSIIRSKKIYCSNGISFKSTKEAADWAGVNRTAISRCANGRTKTSGGFSWSFSGVPNFAGDRYERSAVAMGKKVIRGDGLIFNSTAEAAKSLEALGIMAHQSAISAACRRDNGTSYGYAWRYLVDTGTAAC